VTLGVHVLVDGEDCDRAALADPLCVAAALDALPARLGLRVVAPAQVNAEGDVVAGVVLIAESHISIHALPAEGRVLADVFSCRAFDEALAVAVLREQFGFARHTVRRVTRGSA
jgi:S-adenosylmethionine/arginine decarboxylase-like enzyme